MMFKKIIILSLIFVLFFSFQSAFAYDDQTTHPALTDEIVDFYNLSFPNKQLTLEQKEWIIEGSILEDTAPRWINHFYDPINKIGWSGEYAGKYDAETVKLISQNLIAPFGITPVSSIEWLHNEQLQAKYGFYKGAKTWERGILEMIKGNEKEGYKILGYVLHLIEDASVPDHTRNDTHANELEGMTGDYGSPYEEYLKQYTRQNLNIASDFYQQGLRPIIRNTIDEYLISLAEYSNKYFFSKDTINDPKYQNPKIIRDDENYGYGIDENGEEFSLVFNNKKWDQNTNKYESNYSLSKNKSVNESVGDPVLEAYFSRLSRQAILNGAGVIEFFRNEVVFKKEYSPHPIVYDFSIYNYFAIPRVSITGEWIRAKNTALALAGQIDSAVNNAASSIGDFLSGVFGNNENSQQVAVENSLNQIVVSPAIPLNNQNSQSNTFNQNSISGNQSNLNTTNQIENLSVNQFNNQQLLLLELQSQLNEISNKANNLNQQVQLLALQSANVNNVPVIYYGGGGGAPVILSVSGGSASTEDQQSDNQQQITQDFQQNSTSTDQTASSTETILTATSTLNHLVISEIQISGDKADDEFIEIYNPTSEIISLADYSIQYLSGLATSTVKIGNTKKNFKNDAQIAPYGFYLLAQNNGIFASQADMTYSFSLSGNSAGATIFLNNSSAPISSLTDTSIVNYISYGETSLVGVSTTTISLSGQSIERKAWQNSNCISSRGNNEFSGNGCDNNNEVDFEIRGTPNLQNSSSLPEPRNAPTVPQNFNIQYSSSTSELIFNWLESRDYSGSTSTLIYKIREINNSSSSLPFIETASTNAAIVISEFGRNYEFDILAFDKDGLESATSSVDIYIDTPQDVSATSTDSSATSTQILLSQLDQSSSSLSYNWIYQELGNGISGELKSLELKISPNNSAQWFRLEEFNDVNYSQLSRSFSSGNSDGILHDGHFIVRHADGSVWNQQTISDFGNEIITIEFNNLITDSDKYYRLYFMGGDYSRSVSFNGSNFDVGFGRFIGCNWKRAVGGDGWVYTYNDCYTPDFDIYFVLKGLKIGNTDLENEDDLPIQQ